MELGVVSLGVGLELGSVGRIQLGEGLGHVVSVDLHILGRHPRMRVRLALVGILGNGHNVHPVTDYRVRHIQVLHELGEPGLEIESVVQDKVSLGGLADVPRRWLVAVDLSSGFGDGLHAELVPRNVLGHISQNSKRGQDNGLVITPRG
ncbi:hypothetical protein D3C73_1147740 [compost metagenome]